MQAPPHTIDFHREQNSLKLEEVSRLSQLTRRNQCLPSKFQKTGWHSCKGPMQPMTSRSQYSSTMWKVYRLEGSHSICYARALSLEQQTWMTGHLFTTWLTENILNPLLRSTAQEKNPFKTLLLSTHLIMPELWWRLVFAWLLRQHPSCSSQIKDSFQLSTKDSFQLSSLNKKHI